MRRDEADRRDGGGRGPGLIEAFGARPDEGTRAHGWLEASLYRLADTAWSARRIAPTKDFVLQPARLPLPSSLADMALMVERLYAHARRWAPGFEVPYHVPTVRLSPLAGSAGRYRVDASGYLFIEVSPAFIGQRSALLAILAHEACHHILDLSGIRGRAPAECERLTDLATFICGFGEIILSGHSQIRRTSAGWTRIHLGYLSSEEYRAAQHWVLRAQGLRMDAPRPARTGGLVARMTRWLPEGLPRATDVTAAGPAAQPRYPAPPGRLFDGTARLRRVALARLGGDRSLLDRLVEFERRRQAGGDQRALLEAVLASLARDRR